MGDRRYASVEQTGVVAGSGALADWISVGVLASSVPRDVVDEAIAETGRGVRHDGPATIRLANPVKPQAVA